MIKQRFIQLIQFLATYFDSSYNKEKIELFVDRAKNENAWFSDFLIRHAMQAIRDQFFNEAIWVDFFKNQAISVPLNKQVGLILAGNLPAVGMHDLLMVLASGNAALLKLSSQDRALMEMYIQAMQEFDADIPVQIIPRMVGADAIIATGSDFSSTYFTNYFAAIPHLIRKNRSSLAILTGHESQTDFEGLASDIFTYYGLGCRNVSCIAVPMHYDLIPLFDVLTKEVWVLDHTKYANNYLYHKTLYLLNQIPHYDLGNLIVAESDSLVSPVGVLYVHRYATNEELNLWLDQHADKIQCRVGTEIPFGSAQMPALTDFADGVNTYTFLTSLS